MRCRSLPGGGQRAKGKGRKMRPLVLAAESTPPTKIHAHVDLAWQVDPIRSVRHAGGSGSALRPPSHCREKFLSTFETLAEGYCRRGN